MSLEIIIGNMFSGKTSELIRRLKRYKVLGKRISVITSSKDTRSEKEVIHSHDGVDFECLKVDEIADTLLDENFCESDVVAVDEAQFFDNLKGFVQMCLFLKKTVILAGLDADYKQEKFGEILEFARSGRVALSKKKRKTVNFIKQLEKTKSNKLNI